tara:strand:+ start:406 stop:1041 length:636 start_codon:yes stop_codon:yes gene_type:complete
MSLKELNLDESQKLFEMLAGGAKPADIFDTFAPDDDDIDTIEAGVKFDPKDENNIVYKMLRTLGKDVPDPPDLEKMEEQLPPNAPKVMRELLKTEPITAIATIKVGRDGSLDGFGFDSGKKKNGERLSIEDLIGKLTGDSGDGPKMPKLNGLGGLLGSLAEAASNGVAPSGDMLTIKVGRISIKGGNGSPVNIGVEDVEISAPAPNAEVEE